MAFGINKAVNRNPYYLPEARHVNLEMPLNSSGCRMGHRQQMLYICMATYVLTRLNTWHSVRQIRQGRVQ